MTHAKKMRGVNLDDPHLRDNDVVMRLFNNYYYVNLILLSVLDSVYDVITNCDVTFTLQNYAPYITHGLHPIYIIYTNHRKYVLFS